MLEEGAPQLKRGDVLDVGCGTGWLLEALGRTGIVTSRLHGVDGIDDRAEAARRRVPGALVLTADARRLPYDSGRFELVTLIVVLSSMARSADVAAALAEVRRVLSPTGAVLCYEPFVPNPLNPRTRLVGRREVAAGLGPARAERRLTGFAPLARRLGRATPRAYAPLARALPTHRLTVHGGAGAREPHG